MNEFRLASRFVRAVEIVGAAFLTMVTAATFVSVFMRYLLNKSLPDAHEFSGLLLGIIIFFGIPIMAYRGDHIAIDLLWGALPRKMQRTLDFLSAFVQLACLMVLTWKFGQFVLNAKADNLSTYDLQAPVWPFYGLMWLGLALGLLLVALRIVKLWVNPQTSDPAPIKPLD